MEGDPSQHEGGSECLSDDGEESSSELLSIGERRKVSPSPHLLFSGSLCQRMISAVVSKENNIRDPLNDLLKRIDRSIQKEDVVIHRLLIQNSNQPRDPLPLHHISTHDNLKESLHRTSNMVYRKGDGFVGPINEIYKYKTHPQQVKTGMSYNLSRNSLESEEFSMYDPFSSLLLLTPSFSHSIPSVISIEGYITSHSHRSTVKIPKKKIPTGLKHPATMPPLSPLQHN
jgi:hypothetical protein